MGLYNSLGPHIRIQIKSHQHTWSCTIQPKPKALTIFLSKLFTSASSKDSCGLIYSHRACLYGVCVCVRVSEHTLTYPECFIINMVASSGLPHLHSICHYWWDLHFTAQPFSVSHSVSFSVFYLSVHTLPLVLAPVTLSPQIFTFTPLLPILLFSHGYKSCNKNVVTDSGRTKQPPNKRGYQWRKWNEQIDQSDYVAEA